MNDHDPTSTGPTSTGLTSTGPTSTAPVHSGSSTDGLVPDSGQLANEAAIRDLAIAYGHAVDDRDWRRWESLFTADAHIDYTATGGIAGTPSEVAAWFPEAFTVFEWCMHSMSSHEVTLVDDDTATGRVHVFNRNGVTYEGVAEILDVGAVYDDTYVRVGDTWRFSSRVEHMRYIDGSGFAAMLREALSGS